MSLRAIPLIAIAFVLYAILAVFKVDLSHPMLPAVTLPSKAVWTFTYGHFLILVTLILLFIELLKSAFSSASALIDHALSLVLMIACLVVFIVVPQAGTSEFFFILFATIIDVIAGYTIGTSVARRSLNVGQSDN